MAKIRTFICFELPKDVTIKLRDLILYLKTFGRGVRWVRHDGIHITLKFLGDVEETQIDRIAERLRTIANDFAPFSLTITGKGAFPNFRRPRTFWLGLSAPENTILSIQERIEEALEQEGFERDNRRFTPHLTLGRVKFPDRTISKIAAELERMKVEEIEFDIREIVLMKSDLQPTGAVYTPLHKIELKGTQ